MTVKQLIELLSKMPLSTPVKAWDAESEEYEAVTGVLWDADGVFVQTDE
jgi:hypothetical protein